MLSVTLLCVGKMKEPHYIAAFAEYQKRLGAYCRFTLTEIPEQRLPESPSEALLAAALEKSAKAYDALGNREEAERCIEKALWLREEAAGEMPSDTTGHELAVTCYQAALFRRDAGFMRRALEIWEKLSEKDPAYREYAEDAREALKML